MRTEICARNQSFMALHIRMNCRIHFSETIWPQNVKGGIDIVVHRTTKHLGGPHDTLTGFLVLKNADLKKKLRFIAKASRSSFVPFDNFLIARAIT
jgi:cystathionine beta-lyase/cystathionine gamma-synthase